VRNRTQMAQEAFDSALLDSTNRRIVGELTEEGRLSMAELGRRVGLSAPAVTERVVRLERSGVITGYRADVDPRALGYPLTAFIRVKPAMRQLDKVREVALETPEVVECHRVTGEDCFVLKVCLPSIDALGEILDRFLIHGETTTSIIQSSPLARRDPPVTS
jgi:Lrp/AsnC family transcriptional regulator, leucine-responsive regulatory protein